MEDLILCLSLSNSTSQKDIDILITRSPHTHTHTLALVSSYLVEMKMYILYQQQICASESNCPVYCIFTDLAKCSKKDADKHGVK